MTSAAAPTDRWVPTRDVELGPRFDGVPKYFARGGDMVMSHVLAVLSATFPDGEDFFVRSVAAVRDEIDDPQLVSDLDGFIGQESMHGREHRALNECLAELGYPTRAIGRYVEGVNRFFERFQGRRANLAVTAALEHYTATLAELLLTDPKVRSEIDHEAVRDLFVWHALEEAEHKAVAFDVYRAVGGSERMRILVMSMIHVDFVVELAVWTMISLAIDPDARRRPGLVLRGLAGFLRSPFVSVQAVRQLAQYHRRRFHPNDRDTDALVADWREELFGPTGELTEVLAG